MSYVHQVRKTMLVPPLASDLNNIVAMNQFRWASPNAAAFLGKARRVITVRMQDEYMNFYDQQHRLQIRTPFDFVSLTTPISGTCLADAVQACTYASLE